VENLKKGVQQDNPDLDCRIKLKWILKTWHVVLWNGFIWLRIEEKVRKFRVSYNSGKSFARGRTFQLLKEDSAM
jgi:hypothetical protein